MDTIKSKYHETLAATVIKNLEKRQMEGYYCPTVEDAEKLAFSFLKDGQTVSFGGSMTLEDTVPENAEAARLYLENWPR